MKQRKKKVDPLKTIERKALKNWSKLVRERAGNKCEYCGQTGKYLNCHHIIGRRYKPLKLDLDNGILLCVRCHKWGIGYAAHENPLRIAMWLQTNRQEAYQRLLEKMSKEHRL